MTYDLNTDFAVVYTAEDFLTAEEFLALASAKAEECVERGGPRECEDCGNCAFPVPIPS